MISVVILINGNPIMARSATNTLEVNADGEHVYCLDTGERVTHHRDDGAVPLAKKMLDTIKPYRHPIPAWARVNCSGPQ